MVAVRQRLLGCDHDGLAGVDAHRVEVFHGAHDDGIVSAVTHHLIFVLLPTKDAFLNEDLSYRRVQDTLTRYLYQLTGVVSGATPKTT